MIRVEHDAIVEACLGEFIDHLSRASRRADFAAVLESLRKAAAQLSARMAGEGQIGLSEVLRLLTVVLPTRTLARRSLSPSEASTLSSWLRLACSYCRGELSLPATEVLVDRLAAMPWVPPIPPPLRRLSAARLAIGYAQGLHRPRSAVGASRRVSTGVPGEGGDPTAAPREAGGAGDVLDLDVWPDIRAPRLLSMADCLWDALDEDMPSASNDRIYDASFAPLGVDVGTDTAHLATGSAVRTMEGTRPRTAVALDTLELAALAVSGQLVPLTQALRTAGDSARRTHLIEELAYQTRLICGALASGGLAGIRDAGEVVIDELDGYGVSADRSPDVTHGLLERWQAAMIGLLREPAEPSAQALWIETLCDPLWRRPMDAARRGHMTSAFRRLVFPGAT